MQLVSSSARERWRLVDELFHRALLLDGDERTAFLESACGSDTALRVEVEELLESADHSEDFLQEPVKQVALEYLGAQTREIKPGMCLDHYKIVQSLGCGGMGQVFLAEDLRLGRKVALKLLPQQWTQDPVALGRFKKEAQLLSSLNHPNLLTVYEFCELDGLHFLVTELIEGKTLRKLIAGGRLERSEAIDIAIQLSAGLSVAHSCGIIHRDIKPENVIVRNDGIVKLLDFGIAKLSGTPATGDDAACTATAPGAVLGTPKYMSPEQIRGLPLDTRTDVFSLGVILYEMLSGDPPFAGQTTSDILADVLRGHPASLAKKTPPCPKALSRIVERALAKDREERFATIADLKAELQRYQVFADSKQLVRQDVRGRSPWQRYAPIAVAAIVLCLLCSGLFVWRRIGGHASPKLQRVAVLPFQNTSRQPELDFLGFSLADAIISKLEYVNTLTVRPSSAVNRYRQVGATKDLEKVATDLNVETLLTGSYRRVGPNLEVSLALLDAKPRHVLWSDTVSVPYEKLLVVPDRIAQSVVRGLDLPLSPAEQERMRPSAAVNTRAYEAYLRGVDFYSIGDYPLAVTMLEQAAALDPHYAPIWANLGRAYTTNASLQFGGREGYQKAEHAYEKAIALNPEYPEPRIYMANLFTDTGRVEAAIPLLRVALRSSPNNAEAHWELGYAYRFGGMLQASIAECEQARKLDPEVKINSSAMNTYLYVGQYQKFLNSLPLNDAPYIMFYRGFAEYYLHHLDSATRYFDRAYDLAPAMLPAQIGKGLSDSLAGRSAEGLALLHSVEKRVDERGVSDAEGIYKIAQGYAVLGDKAGALRMLQRSIEGGFFCFDYFAQDPLLNSLRQSEQFQELLTQARERQQRFQRRFGTVQVASVQPAA